jgi:hypothetical protein
MQQRLCYQESGISELKVAIYTTFLFLVLLLSIKLELCSLVLAMLYLNDKFGAIEALANLRALFPYGRIKIRSELENYMLINLCTFVYANHI